MNNVRKKILLLLVGGVAFGYSITPGQQGRVLKTISREWSKLSRKELTEGISYLYKLDFIEKEKAGGGLINIKLTKKGRLKALNDQLKNIKNKKQKWDKKWRMVAFDVPEKYKRGRDALRHKLKEIGFCELQKSVFITPYDCQKEIKLLVEFFELEKFVRFGILESIDNESYLKKSFKLG